MDQEKLLVMTDVREAWLFVRRNLKLIGLITLGVTLFSILLSIVLPSSYEGATIVMLDPRKTKVTGMDAVVSGLAPDGSAIRSEMDIIQSRAVIDRVISEEKLLNDADFNGDLPIISWVSGLFSSKEPATHDKEEDMKRTKVAERLQKKLNVTNDGRSYSIVIKFRNHNPEKAAKIANAFADQYLVDQLEVKFDATQRANNWIQKRLEGLRNEVSAAETAVENYKKANNLIGTGDATITEQQLGAINTQLLQARAELSQAQARLNGIKGLTGSALETSSTVQSSPLISQLKQQEAEVRRKEADLSTRYGDRHPMIINTRNELRSIHDKIQEEVSKIATSFQNDVNMSQGKVDSLEKELTKLEGKTGEGNQSMVTLRQLQREAAASRSLYEGFLTRFKQVAEQQDLQVADARVIARAETPPKPVFPNFWVFLAIGIVLGSIIGFMAALMLELLDRGFRAIATIEKVCGVPGLGITPVAETAEGQLPSDYVLEKPLSAYAESIRSIRTAIHFSNVDEPPKVMMVTSSLPGEGKTVFSVTFARVLAKSGAKVLLIDADMRRPRIHSVLGLDKTKPDLAQVLAHDATLESALQRDASGADVIIASSKTPNPQDLLGSKQMVKLLATVRERYDIIIIDTPPVMAVADAPVVSKLADTTIYIVRWASTPREVVSEGLKQLQNFNIKLAGIVLSQVNLDEQKQYGYGDYGYYYGRYKDYYTN